MRTREIVGDVAGNGAHTREKTRIDQPWGNMGGDGALDETRTFVADALGGLDVENRDGAAGDRNDAKDRDALDQSNLDNLDNSGHVVAGNPGNGGNIGGMGNRERGQGFGSGGDGVLEIGSGLRLVIGGRSAQPEEHIRLTSHTGHTEYTGHTGHTGQPRSEQMRDVDVNGANSVVVIDSEVVRHDKVAREIELMRWAHEAAHYN